MKACQTETKVDGADADATPSPNANAFLAGTQGSMLLQEPPAEVCIDPDFHGPCILRTRDGVGCISNKSVLAGSSTHMRQWCQSFPELTEYTFGDAQIQSAAVELLVKWLHGPRRELQVSLCFSMHARH